MITFKSGITEKHAVENSTAPNPHFGQTHEPKLWERAGSDSDAQIGKHAHRWLPFAPPDAAPVPVCPDGGRHLEPPMCPAAAGPAKGHSETALPLPEGTVWSEMRRQVHWAVSRTAGSGPGGLKASLHLRGLQVSSGLCLRRSSRGCLPALEEQAPISTPFPSNLQQSAPTDRVLLHEWSFLAQSSLVPFTSKKLAMYDKKTKIQFSSLK